MPSGLPDSVGHWWTLAKSCKHSTNISSESSGVSINDLKLTLECLWMFVSPATGCRPLKVETCLSTSVRWDVLQPSVTPAEDERVWKMDGWIFDVVCVKREHDSAVNHWDCDWCARSKQSVFFRAFKRHIAILHLSFLRPATFHLMFVYQTRVINLSLLLLLLDRKTRCEFFRTRYFEQYIVSTNVCSSLKRNHVNAVCRIMQIVHHNETQEQSKRGKKRCI